MIQNDDFHAIADENHDSDLDDGELNGTVNEISRLVPTIIDNLAQVGYDKTLLIFMQVNVGQFSLQNISLYFEYK